MKDGWNCPKCGGAHGPHVDTCPVPTIAQPWPGVDPRYPGTGYITQPNTWSQSYNTNGTRVVDAVTGRDLGPAD